MYKDKTLVLYSAVIMLLGVVFPAAVMADPAALESEIKSYSEIFKTGSLSSKKKAINKLEWLGISDARVYDPLAELILAKLTTTEKVVAKQFTYYIKALAFSGHEKYKKILQKIESEASHRYLIKHSRKALIRLENHARWNPVIAAGLDKAEVARNDIQRVKNMLASDMPVLQLIGTKKIYRTYSQETKLLDAAEKLLLAGYQHNGKSKRHVDVMAWLCKALGNSGNVKFKATLQEAADNAASKKVRKYAKKNLLLL